MPPAFACTTCGQTYDAYRVRCLDCAACTIKKVDTRPDVPHTVDGDAPVDFDAEPTLVPLSDIEPEILERMPCGIAGIDEIFGGGIVRRKAVIIASPPGIGKTTVTLQIADGIGKRALFVSAEMPPSALSALGKRMELDLTRVFPIQETQLEAIELQIARIKPAMVVIDSIQEIETERNPSRAGSPSQLVECSKRLAARCKVDGFALWLIGHVTADDRMAGPRTLEHVVDAVLEIGGRKEHPRRIVRAGKNRIPPGSGRDHYFTMTARGLIPRDGTDDEPDDGDDDLIDEDPPTDEGAN